MQYVLGKSVFRINDDGYYPCLIVLPIAKIFKVSKLFSRSQRTLTKIHAIVDAFGNHLKFILTGGQRRDITQVHRLSSS